MWLAHWFLHSAFDVLCMRMRTEYFLAYSGRMCINAVPCLLNSTPTVWNTGFQLKCFSSSSWDNPDDITRVFIFGLCGQTVAWPFNLKNMKESKELTKHLIETTSANLSEINWSYFYNRSTSWATIPDNVLFTIQKTDHILIWTEDQDKYSVWFL